MGTIQPGFWTCRFLIAPEEFAAFAKKCHEHRCKFVFVKTCYDSPVINIEKAILQYGITYNNIMFQIPIEVDCFIAYAIISESFKNGLLISCGNYGNFPFVQISSPKGYAVDEEDGKHFHYEDVHGKESEAETVYKELTADIKKCTKPLYNAGRPIYSIRVSEKAGSDMKDNIWFIHKFPNLSSKW